MSGFSQMAQKIITLLTDFGCQDSYVAVMKGVIYAIAQAQATNLVIVDITHTIPPQDIAAARFNLLQAWNYFPPGTVHVAVVDPGVGSRRRAIAVEFAGGFLVGPDNGLLGGVLDQSPARTVVELTNRRYWRTPDPSSTFHGRDIFAAAGAYLAGGIPLEQLGARIGPESLLNLALPPGQTEATAWRGVVQYIDTFGNLITNIPGLDLHHRSWSVTIQGHTIGSYPTYSESQPGELLCLIGSHQWVEIAVNGGNAQAELKVAVGTPVLCQIDDPVP